MFPQRAHGRPQQAPNLTAAVIEWVRNDRRDGLDPEVNGQLFFRHSKPTKKGVERFHCRKRSSHGCQSYMRAIPGSTVVKYPTAHDHSSPRTREYVRGGRSVEPRRPVIAVNAAVTQTTWSGVSGPLKYKKVMDLNARLQVENEKIEQKCQDLENQMRMDREDNRKKEAKYKQVTEYLTESKTHLEKYVLLQLKAKFFE